MLPLAAGLVVASVLGGVVKMVNDYRGYRELQDRPRQPWEIGG